MEHEQQRNIMRSSPSSISGNIGIERIENAGHVAVGHGASIQIDQRKPST